ncbi:hypothetical protein D3C73_1469960 [compost metagenome]
MISSARATSKIGIMYGPAFSSICFHCSPSSIPRYTNNIDHGITAKVVRRINLLIGIFAIPAGIEIACLATGINLAVKITPEPYFRNQASETSICFF